MLLDFPRTIAAAVLSHAKRLSDVHVFLNFDIYVRTLLSVLVGGFRGPGPQVPVTSHDACGVPTKGMWGRKYALTPTTGPRKLGVMGLVQFLIEFHPRERNPLMGATTCDSRSP